MKKQYDVAAYIWPAYQYDKRAEFFWPKGIGEWETVMEQKPKRDGLSFPRKPLWGYVNENDPYVMEMEINAAADHGVNVFVYDWYWFDRRPFLEACLNDGFLKARNNDRMKFFLMWANHNVSVLWDKRLSDGIHTAENIWEGGVDRAEYEKICNRLIEKYFGQPNYYCIDGKPVFMIYHLANLIEGLGGIAEMKDALQWLRNRMVECGFPGIELQCRFERYGDPMVMDNADEIAACFDSLMYYNMGDCVDTNRDYREAMGEMTEVWERDRELYGMPTYAQVSLGWDTNPRFNDLWFDVTTNVTPEAVEDMFRAARDYVDRHPEQAPLITINSWNEWTETEYLQPDDLNGYAFLEAAKKVFVDEAA